MGVYLNPGNAKFKMALNSQIYVDKSELIKETNDAINTLQRFICVSRPRRFGKSVTADMLAAYYDKNCDSAQLFDGLKIAQEISYKENLNKYNVIVLNIQDFLSLTKDVTELLECLQCEVIKELQKEYRDYVIPDARHLSLTLSSIYNATSDQFIFIIDEWDCILREKKIVEEQYQQYLDFLRNLLKDKNYVALAYMTGILPIKKYGTHSALNMFDEISMITPGNYATYMGFTEEEVEALCKQYEVDFEKVANWYDGYTFSTNIHIYNPKSVVDSIRHGSFSSYWTQTETYEALREYIDMDLDGLRNAITRMLAGEDTEINPRHFQNDMTTFAEKDDVLTLLVHLGYLTYDTEQSTVRIPNNEVRMEFETAIEGSHWNEVTTAIKNSKELLQSTIDKNESRVAELIELCHENNTSILNYNDENALSCVIALAYYHAMNDYKLIRELPTGKGYADIAFFPKKNSNKPAMIIELKYNKDADTAIKQIKAKRYAGALQAYTNEVLLVGINYDKSSKHHTCKIEEVKQ